VLDQFVGSGTTMIEAKLLTDNDEDCIMSHRFILVTQQEFCKCQETLKSRGFK